jgi:hypothetical protein
MNQAVKVLKNEPSKTVEVVVHVNEELDEDQRDSLTSVLKSTAGVTDVEFCPSRCHLMLVTYDRDVYSSQAVLRRINSQQVHAQLVGPV